MTSININSVYDRLKYNYERIEKDQKSYISLHQFNERLLGQGLNFENEYWN